jgi:ribosomal protein L12E/L44/L45/RPP1/RPP2
MVEEAENHEADVHVTEFLELSAVTVPGFPETSVGLAENDDRDFQAVEKFVESLEDPDFQVGDFAQWEFSDGTSQGEVTDMESEEGEGFTIGDTSRVASEENGPAYELQEWDEEEEEFTNRVIKVESELSTTDRPESAPGTAPRNQENTTSETTDTEREELMDGAFPVPNLLMYEDREAANMAAQMLGVDGVHTHVVEGGEMHMPGKTHELFFNQVGSPGLQGMEEQNHETEKEEEGPGAQDRGMEPFAGYQDFDDCVQQNQDKDDPEAYCAAIKDKVEKARRMKKVKEAVSDVDLTPPEKVVNAAQEALDAKERFSEDLGDCGTGVGESRAERIVSNDLRPEDFLGGENTAIPDYLRSHEEDIAGLESPPTDWTEEEWTGRALGEDDSVRCGPVQYALWGFHRDWADRTEEELRSAKEEALENHEAMSQNKGQENQEVSTEQLEDPSEEELYSFVADQHPEVSAQDVTELLGDFNYSFNERSLHAFVADMADVSLDEAREALGQLADTESQGMHGDEDDEEEPEMDEGRDVNKNGSDREGSVSETEDMDRTALEEEVKELRRQVQNLESAEPSKANPAAGASVSEDSDDSSTLPDKLKDRLEKEVR